MSFSCKASIIATAFQCASTAFAAHPVWAESGGATVISGEFYETHDRLPPHEWRGIEMVHRFTFTLTGNGDVKERWSGAMIGGGDNPEGTFSQKHETGTGIGARPANPDLSPYFARNSALGTNSGVAAWRVIGERKLQRFYQGQRMLMTMKFDITSDNACNVEVKFLKQIGFVSVVMSRGDNGQPAEFSLPKVTSASCSIK
jgi:hypothetical protein